MLWVYGRYKYRPETADYDVYRRQHLTYSRSRHERAHYVAIDLILKRYYTY